MARLFYLESWREYCKAFSPDLPKPFADITGILWLGVVLGKKLRLLSVPGVESRLPLIWALLVSPPASLKTTAMQLLIQALPSVAIPVSDDEIEEMPLHLELAGSPEGVLDTLSLLSGNSLLLWVEEFVSVLSATRRNTYAAEWRNFLLRAYHPSFSLTRSLRKQKIVVKNIMPFFITAITPQNLMAFGGLEEVRTGFLTRFVPIWVEDIKKTSTIPNPDDGDVMLMLIHDHAQKLASHPSRDFLFPPDVKKQYNELMSELEEKEYQNDEEKIWAMRAFEFVPRASLLLAGVEVPPNGGNFIPLECWNEAERMFRQHILPSIKNVMEFLTATDEPRNLYPELYRLLEWLAPRKEATRSEILRRFHWKSDFLDKIGLQGEDLGYLFVEDGFARGKKGRPEQKWTLHQLPEDIIRKIAGESNEDFEKN
jgi:hypothetical protein